jgi:hypothetical protein
VKEKTREKFLEKVAAGKENSGLGKKVHPQSLGSDKRRMTSSLKKFSVNKILETEGDAEENAQTLDGRVFLEKYGYLTNNEKFNNFIRK